MPAAAVAYLPYTDWDALASMPRKHRLKVAAAIEGVDPTAEAILEKAPAIAKMGISG